MKVGLVYMLSNPARLNRPLREFYAETLDNMQAVEGLGFDSINITEFHFGGGNTGTPSPLVWNTAAAVRTKRAMIGQCVMLMPYGHPVKLAEDMATIDLLSGGRFWLQAGEGAMRETFQSFGIELKDRAGLTAEGMDVVRKCWTEEEFSYEGQYYHLKNVRLNPKPFQKPHPAMFLSAMVPGLKPMERTIEMGFNAATGHGYDYRGEEGWEEWHAGWTEAVRRHGKDPAQFQTSAVTYLYVTDDPERMWNKHRAYEPERRPSGQARETYGRPGPRSQYWSETPQNPFKTPDEAARWVRSKYGKHPPDHLLFHADRPGMTYAEVLDCHGLFMRKVVPQIRDLL